MYFSISFQISTCRHYLLSYLFWFLCKFVKIQILLLSLRGGLGKKKWWHLNSCLHGSPTQMHCCMYLCPSHWFMSNTFGHHPWLYGLFLSHFTSFSLPQSLKSCIPGQTKTLLHEIFSTSPRSGWSSVLHNSRLLFSRCLLSTEVGAPRRQSAWQAAFTSSGHRRQGMHQF